MAPSTLSQTLQGFLITTGKRQRRDKGQVIQTTGEQKTFNLIRAGYVKRYLIANDGSLGIEAIYGPSDVFSMSSIYQALFNQTLYDGPETYYYEAMTDCEIYSIDIDVLIQEVKKNPMLYRDLLIEAGKRLHFSIQGLENISMKSAYNRTAHQLLHYARKFGHHKKDGIELTLPLTHQDLANVLSLSRETVSVSFMALRKKGLIRGRKKVYVTDLEKLEEEAYS
jgi:CRP/FNR family transcriptional regulator, cyclic AMP receptor protein